MISCRSVNPFRYSGTLFSGTSEGETDKFSRAIKPIYSVSCAWEAGAVNVIIRDLDQTRIHFEAAVARLGEQAATRAFNRALNSWSAPTEVVHQLG